MENLINMNINGVEPSTVAASNNSEDLILLDANFHCNTKQSVNYQITVVISFS